MSERDAHWSPKVNLEWWKEEMACASLRAEGVHCSHIPKNNKSKAIGLFESFGCQSHRWHTLLRHSTRRKRDEGGQLPQIWGQNAATHHTLTSIISTLNRAFGLPLLISLSRHKQRNKAELTVCANQLNVSKEVDSSQYSTGGKEVSFLKLKEKVH